MKQGQHVAGELSTSLCLSLSLFLSFADLFLSRFRLRFHSHSPACLSHKGLAEYVVAHEQFTCVLTDKQKAMEESVVAAWQGARIEGKSLSLFSFSLSQQRADSLSRSFANRFYSSLLSRDGSRRSPPLRRDQQANGVRRFRSLRRLRRRVSFFFSFFSALLYSHL